MPTLTALFRKGCAVMLFVPVLMAAIALASAPALAETKKTVPAKSASAKKSASNKKPVAKKKTTKSKKTSSKKSSNADRNAQSDLDRVQEQIRSAEKRIKLTREQREQKEAEVRAAEVEIGALKGNMGVLQKDVSGREQRLQQLQAEKAAREHDRDRLVNHIKADMQMAQRQGGQDYYKLLLNQQDPQTLARLMKYYGYMQQARASRVQDLNGTLARLDEIAREEEESVQRLRALRGDLQQKQSRLSSAQQQRNQTIRLLNAQLDSDDDKLQKLRRDQQALQAVMERLAREAVEREQREAERRRQEQAVRAAAQAKAAQTKPADSQKSEVATRPLPAPVQADFKAQSYKGRCPLPVAGGVRASFGGARAGGLRWNGIVVAAPSGTAVRAIRPGRIAFADYLRGYGFLIIVDHGRGLMSLYGQNQSLQKKAGEEVGGNEVIATVGDSGGNDMDGLYFEIRVRGKPVDPAGWCAYQ
ncbi:MAG: murein hydrolase activator EnvC family protein [Moraxellaceae bacterium]